jgi:hypothetical protein
MRKLKIFSSLLVVLLMSSLSFSQEALNDLNEFRLNYGRISTEHYMLLIYSAIAGTTIGGIYNEKVKDLNGTFFGPVMIQYQKSFRGNRFTVGGLLGYSKASTEVVYESSPEKKFTFDISYFILMAQSEFKYVNGKDFQFYSGIDLGIDIITPTGTDTKGNSSPTGIGLAFQLTPFGFNFGSDKIGGNLEFGIGSKGLINAGLYARF